MRLERLPNWNPANRANGLGRILRVPSMVVILSAVELSAKTLSIVGKFRAACPACVGYHRHFLSILISQVYVLLQPSSPPFSFLRHQSSYMLVLVLVLVLVLGGAPCAICASSVYAASVFVSS